MGVRGVLPHSTLTRSYISYLASLSTFPIGKAGTTLSPRAVRRPESSCKQSRRWTKHSFSAI